MSHPAELSGHDVWIRLLRGEFCQTRLRCLSQLRSKGERWPRGLDAAPQVPGRRRVALQAPGSGCDTQCPQPILSSQPRPVPGATEPTAGPHILPPEPALQLRCSIKGPHFAFTQPFASQPAGIPFLKSKQHFTTQASCLKSSAVQQGKKKKGGGKSQKIKIPKLRANP